MTAEAIVVRPSVKSGGLGVGGYGDPGAEARLSLWEPTLVRDSFELTPKSDVAAAMATAVWSKAVRMRLSVMATNAVSNVRSSIEI